jgi:hypothetical protein
VSVRPEAGVVLILSALVAIGGPVGLGLAGLLRKDPTRAADPRSQLPWDGRLTISSALIYTLAFNLIFLLQELFLVLPKALTPGLHATLYHNNHGWTGENPLARLFQGTGALVILLVGLAAVGWLKRSSGRSTTLRLFVIWIAFCGLFESLPQVVVGAVLPQNDVGLAMDYLRLPPIAMLAAAIASLAAIAAAGSWLALPLLEVADDPARVEGRARRTQFIFRTATLPALSAILLILLFRVPGSIDQVVIVPVAVTVIGIAWIQASAWRYTEFDLATRREAPSIRAPLVALLLLLVVFQVILRPGIAF